jgi:hypothetical protein
MPAPIPIPVRQALFRRSRKGTCVATLAEEFELGASTTAGNRVWYLTTSVLPPSQQRPTTRCGRRPCRCAPNTRSGAAA